MKKGKKKAQQTQGTSTLNIPLEEEEVLGPTPPEQHHHISKDIRHKVDVLKWLADNKDDPALNVRNIGFQVINVSYLYMNL